VKVACAGLRGRRGGNAALLPDHLTAAPVGLWAARVTEAQPQVKPAVRPARHINLQFCCRAILLLWRRKDEIYKLTPPIVWLSGL